MFCEADEEATMLHFGDGFEMKRHERLLLRPWLENLIDSSKIVGLEWIDSTRTLFRVPWKHQSRKTWSLGHSSVFLEWAKNTGRWKEGDPEPHYAQLKTRLRCAFSKAPDIEEVKEMHCSKAEEPYKVYRFIPKKESRFYPFGRKAIARKSIHSSLRRSNMLPGCHPSLGNAVKKFDVKPVPFRSKMMKGFDEAPVVTCNDVAADDIAEEPVPANMIPLQVERLDDFHGHILESNLIVSNSPTSTAYPPIIHAVFDSLSIPQIATTTDFKVTTETATEVDEFYCGMRQTILPPVDGSLSRPESKNSGMELPNSMSVMVSQNPHCIEVLQEKESVSDLDLSDLPKMSIMEKVESWKMTGFTTGSNETGQLKTPILDDWITKVTERTTGINSTTDAVCRNNSDGVKSFREMVIGDNNWAVQDTYCGTTRDHKKISLGKSEDFSGSNVAVATPIFPLKNRYNISRNHPDKETLMPQSPNDRSFFPHNNTSSAPSFVTAQNGRRVPLENAKCGDQQMFQGATDLDWHSGEKRRKLDENTVAVPYHTFPDDPNNFGGNWNTSQDACRGNWQKQGEVYEESWLQGGNRQNENWQMQSKEEDVIWQTSFSQQNRNWQEGRNENGQMPSDRLEAKFELSSCNTQGQNSQTANRFPDRNVKSFAGQNDGSWDLYERSPNGSQPALPNGGGGDRGRNWPLENANEVEAHWGILRENLIKDGPLDLSNKTDFYVHYTIDNHGGLCPPEICAKMADHTPDFSRAAEDPGQNCRRMEHTKGWGNLNVEQHSHGKKLSHHALSMDSSLNHLKAAYKKLVLRTMYVTEKERELDNLEKNLHAREEAVRHKEQQLQKALWTLAERRLPVELGKQLNCTKVFPEVGKSSWNVDDNQRKINMEHSTMPRWPEHAESCIQSPTENVISMKSYVVSGDQHQIHDRTGYSFDLGDDNCGTTRILKSPVEMCNSNQPFYEPAPPPRVLPSVDKNPCLQNEYIRSRYLDEADDGHPSGVYLPAASCSYHSSSAVASHALSWGGGMKDSGEDRILASGRTGVVSGRPFPNDPKLGSISMNSCSVLTIGESCAAKTFGGRCFERRTFESPEQQNNIVLLRNSSFSSLPPVSQSSNEVTRILPPVSPDVGLMN